MPTKDLLIEIGTEELPPKALRNLAVSFADEIHAGLEKYNLTHRTYKWFATPRRLAVVVEKLAVQQKDHEVVRKGPSLNAAYDKDGKPNKAAQGFAGSCGISVQELEIQKTKNGSWLVYRAKEKGSTTLSLLPTIIETALSRLPIPKRMRWSDLDTEFVRPVHWSVVLFGRETVACKILNTNAGNETFGHRFHHPKAVKISSSATYLKKLREKAFVIADFTERKNIIKNLVTQAANKLDGKIWLEDQLLDEVTALVEWPVMVTGSFDKKFLELPTEVLIATLQDHQKFFPVLEKQKNRLLPHFIAIANIESKHPDEVKRGYERVVRPRLSDAAFFWQQDCKRPLADHCNALRDVVFQQNLGTLHDKTERVKQLCGFVADEIKVDSNAVKRAAVLSKCDLFTDMVNEFPKLQGTMGRYYALNDNEPSEVAVALEEQYLPRFAGDNLPETDAGRILSIADKLDTILGIFAIGQSPSGEKDPYALRRLALGCLRIMIECELELDLEACLEFARRTYAPNVNTHSAEEKVFDFMMDRLRHYYIDKGVRVDVYDAVLAIRPSSPYDFDRRIRAVTDFSALPEAESLAAANKRIHNILRQAGGNITPAIDTSLFTEDAEKNLANKLGHIVNQTQPLAANGNYTEVLKELSQIRNDVDAFFDNVMVMVDDEELRNARLQLLALIRNEFQQIADISLLQG